MNENRDLINSELKNTFDGGLISLANEQPSNFVELPNEEEAKITESGNVVNNFNVNVNVNSKNQNSAPIEKNKATTIVNNILNSESTKSPENLKKNSSETSNSTGGNNTIILENGKSAIQLLEQTMNAGPEQPTLDIRQLDYYSPDKPSDYSYSEAPIKSKNLDLKRSYDILHSMTDGALTDHHEMSPLSDTIIHNEFTNQLKESSFNYYESSNIKLDTNQPKIHDQVSEVSEKNDKRLEMREQEKDLALSEMSKNQSKRVDNELEISEIKDGRDISGNVLSGAKVLNTSGARNFNNLSSRSSTIPLFVDKMNSPPIWRTALG